MNSILGMFLTPTVINAVLRHVVTAGATAAIAKGWVSGSTVAELASYATIAISAVTAGASSTPASVAKQTAKNGLVAVPVAAAHDPTWSDPNAR